MKSSIFKKSNRGKIILVVAVLAILALYVYPNYIQPALNQSNRFLTVAYYDSNGRPIQPTLSVVGGTPYVTYIALTAHINNTGDYPLSCLWSRVATTPSAYVSALGQVGAVSVPVGTNSPSTSALISVAQLEGGTTTFTLAENCSYTDSLSNYKSFLVSGSLPLVITKDLSGSASISISNPVTS